MPCTTYINQSYFIVTLLAQELDDNLLAPHFQVKSKHCVRHMYSLFAPLFLELPLPSK